MLIYIENHLFIIKQKPTIIIFLIMEMCMQLHKM